MLSTTHPKPMTARDVWVHLRLSFSIYLLPICLFAVTQSPDAEPVRTLAVLLIIHVLLYPAANTYNSYFDKDEGSINGIEAPPPVDRTLFWVSWSLTGLSLALGALINWPFVLYLLIYSLIMQAYSHDRIRLKKYPVISWLVISILQGGITYLGAYLAVSDLPLSALAQPRPLFAALLATLNILALYPITQIYQHEEDAQRGDMTFSRLLGVQGTFICAMVFLGLSAIGFYLYFAGGTPFYLMLVFVAPAMAHLLMWYARARHDARQVDYRSAMRMTQLAGYGMNAFFITLLILDKL